MARFIAQIIIVGAQVVGRTFTQALRQEFQSGAAAQRASKGAQEGAKRAAANSVSGLNLQDMLQCSKGELRRLDSKLLARTFRPTMPQRESIESSAQFIILAFAMTLLAYNLH